MRILHIIDTMSPAAGGPTEVVRMLVQHAPPGYESEIVTLDAPDAPFLGDLRCPTHGLGQAERSFYSPALLPWLRENRSRFDAAFVHGLWNYQSIAVRRAFAGKTPYAVFPHGMLDPYFKRASTLKHLKKYPFWLLAEFWNLRAATHTLFTTTAERDLARESFIPYICRPTVAALGTEPAPPDTLALREAFYEACPAARDRRFLLYLGRIHPKKGADLLLRAFASLADEHPDVDLVMAGPGSGDWGQQLRSTLSACLQTRIHWPGMLRGASKHGAFRSSEAFILPSHQENFGIAVVESLAASRPALLTHPVNIAVDIEADHAGFAEPDTLEGISRLMKRWLSLTPGERQTMSTNALHCFQNRYDMRHNAHAILRIFENAHERPA